MYNSSAGQQPYTFFPSSEMQFFKQVSVESACDCRTTWDAVSGMVLATALASRSGGADFLLYLIQRCARILVEARVLVTAVTVCNGS